MTPDVKPKFDFNAMWEDAVAMLRVNRDLMIAVAGLFLFLPGLLTGHFAGSPQTEGLSDPQDFLAAFSTWMNAHWYWIWPNMLLSMIGSLAILFLLLGRDRPTVGQALALSFGAILPYLLVTLLSGMAIMAGLLLFILPGFYLMVKFQMIAPALVAEGLRHPIDLLRRSWMLTKGYSLMITLFLILIIVVAFVLTLVIGVLFSLLINLVSSGEIATFLMLFVNTLLDTMSNVVLLVVSAAIYRWLVVVPR